MPLEVPDAFATQKVRSERLRHIRSVTGQTQLDFSRDLGCVSATYYQHLERGRKHISMTHVLLAEVLLERHLMKRVIPANIPVDARLREKVISMHKAGIPDAEIVYALALRLDIVQYWVCSMEALKAI